MSDVLDRFLRYVTYDTRSDEKSKTCPSTENQLVLLRLLADELRAIGLDDAAVDENGYLTATIPATTRRSEVPTIGFIAHVDTSPEMSGAGVKPIVHRAWDGQDIQLPDDQSGVLRAADYPDLADRVGDDIVTASGTTLLGADNKAGVAEIVAAAKYLVEHPEIAHGPIRIGFTPDEEIGRGADRFDVARFGAACAYTMDGGRRGEVEWESFSADAVTATFTGFNTHPGYGRARLVNAIKVAADFVALLPRDTLSPETTEGRDGFVHPYTAQGGVDRAWVKLIVRDFDTRELATKEALIERLAADAVARHPGSSVELLVEQQYRNMKEVLDRHPQVVEYAFEAVRRTGIEPRTRPIRGGTDGSRLSFMGLPTPNLFAGEHNFHSRLEWVSAQDMEKAVETIVQLARVWEENG